MDDKTFFILGFLAISPLIQTYAFISNGKAVIIKPPTVISVAKNPDLPSYSYYPPLHSVIGQPYSFESS